MRRNLYHRDVKTFLVALTNSGWREVSLKQKLPNRHFRKARFHLILKKRKLGYYCVIHQDRFLMGRLHKRPVTKSKELTEVFREIMKEYMRLRA